MALSTNGRTKIFLLVRHYSIYMAAQKINSKDKASKTTKKTAKKVLKKFIKEKVGRKPK